ncbi:TetR/AcrR family transcriptional regulator [Streptacidiphilus sp. EB129]|jgi:AcrR family transcriptional regulator|uniref:TetR/AcrR family transcriptional regulator n=1 Tax=Streptacidiphilus sp. EB129 TaxID=3156262 RepID=UPI0035147CA6
MPRRYSMEKRAPATAAVRQQLIDATLAELVAVGGGAITLQGVADRADLALRTLYNHFPNRDALLSAAFVHHTAQTRAAVEAMSLPDAEPEEQLRHAVRAYYSRYAVMGPRLTVLLSLRGFPDLDEQVRAIRAWRRGVLGQIIARARQQGVLAVPESTAVALAFTMTSHASWQILASELGGAGPESSEVAGQALSAALFHPHQPPGTPD